MRIAFLPESLVEAVGLLAGLVPRPLVQVAQLPAMVMTMLVGVKLDVFEQLAGGPLSAAEVATKTRSSAHGMEKLLNALVGTGYVRIASDSKYALDASARKWLLKSSKPSLRDSMLFGMYQWNLVGQYERYVRTGKPTDPYQGYGDEQWLIYENFVRSNAAFLAPELVKKTPVLKNAQTMLDLGGGQGHLSVAYCQKWPGLRSTVIDLPPAIATANAAPMPVEVQGRVSFQEGDALTVELGAELYDFIFLGQLLHHFDDATCANIVKRAAQALKPRGLLAICEVIRPDAPGTASQTVLLGDLFFASFSAQGTWSFPDMDGWAAGAGLAVERRHSMITVPGFGLFCARRG